MRLVPYIGLAYLTLCSSCAAESPPPISGDTPQAVVKDTPASTVSDTPHVQRLIESLSADQTALTIYPDNLAMITETRTVTLPQGRSTVRFLGVSDQIIPQTAVLQNFEGFTLESNFDGELITKATLLSRSVGQTLTLRRLNPGNGDIRTVQAKLISAPRRNPSKWNPLTIGTVFDINGKIETLDCSGLYETLIFNDLPRGLYDKPMLSMEVNADTAGEKEVSLSYLSSGIDWEADYRLDVNKSDTEGQLTGWLTLTNNTAKSFDNAPTAIVAGQLNRDNDTRSEKVYPVSFYPTCWPQGSTKTGTAVREAAIVTQSGKVMGWDGGMYESASQVPALAQFAPETMTDEIVVTAQRRAERENLGDYKLYRTPQPVTVAAYQTKQIAFLDVDNAELSKRYVYELKDWMLEAQQEDEPSNTVVQYDLDNSRDGNIAQPLPRGIMRVMTKRPNGLAAYLGEDNVRDLAVDLPVEIDISQSVAVQVQPRFEAVRDGSDRLLRFTADIFNATPKTVTTRIKFDTDRLRKDNFSETSHTPLADKIRPTFDIKVPAEKQSRLTVDIPLIRSIIFDTNSLFDRRAKAGKHDRVWPRSEYRLKGSGGPAPWVLGHMDDKLKAAGYMDVTYLEDTRRVTGEDGERLYRVSQELTFVNPLNEPQTVYLAYDTPKTLIIVDSSIPPDSAERAAWTIELPAKSRKSMTLTIDGDF